MLEEYSELCTTIVVFGASGDLAKRKTFPALFNLLKYNFLSESSCKIIGYARSPLDQNEFLLRACSNLKTDSDQFPSTLRNFQSMCKYLNGDYDQESSYLKLKEYILKTEKERSQFKQFIRLFYLALPPSVFVAASKSIKKYLYSESIQCRLIVEKPFGRDLESSNILSQELSKIFLESEIYRIDHYLGKEMVKNVLILRFANTFFKTIWNRESIANIQITFKENIGVEGRGGYFDSYGIIRDVMQNHLMQMLSLVAMDEPGSLDGERIRDEKVLVLSQIDPLTIDDVLLGQYVASLDGTSPGYLDDPSIPAGSLSATYAAAVIHINNTRWKSVPFILKCGKGLDCQKTEIRVQFKDPSDPSHPLFPLDNLARNELVIRVSPSEAVYLNLMVKKPGLGYETVMSTLDLTYKSQFENIRIPDAYESLLLDVIRGDHSNFVRSDELAHAWRIFTPLLHHIESQKVVPAQYPFGSRGPESETAFVESEGGYQRSSVAYFWKSSTGSLQDNDKGKLAESKL